MSILTLPAGLVVGIAPFDRDHQILVEEMNALYEAVVVRRAEAAEAALQTLERVLRGHFAQEEHLLAYYGYPLLPRHVAGHAEVLARLDGIARAVDARHWSGLAERVEAMIIHKLEALIVDDLDYRWWFDARGIVPRPEGVSAAPDECRP